MKNKRLITKVSRNKMNQKTGLRKEKKKLISSQKRLKRMPHLLSRLTNLWTVLMITKAWSSLYPRSNRLQNSIAALNLDEVLISIIEKWMKNQSLMVWIKGYKRALEKELLAKRNKKNKGKKKNWKSKINSLRLKGANLNNQRWKMKDLNWKKNQKDRRLCQSNR